MLGLLKCEFIQFDNESENKKWIYFDRCYKLVYATDSRWNILVYNIDQNTIHFSFSLSIGLLQIKYSSRFTLYCKTFVDKSQTCCNNALVVTWFKFPKNIKKYKKC